jgi:hypothetical protein
MLIVNEKGKSAEKQKQTKTFKSAVGSEFVLWLSSNCLVTFEKLT